MLPLRVKAGWGFADTGINIFVIVKQLIVFNFMVQYLGVNPATAGLITGGVLIFDVITDPLIGWLSDRSTSRYGRRIPYMVIGAVLLALFTVMIFALPATMTGTPAALWVAAFFVLATIGFTMVVIPFGALAAEMTDDPRERSTMTAFRMASASFGILLAGAVFPMLTGGTREGHLFAALVFSAVIILPIWIAAFSVRNTPKVLQPNSDTFTEQLKVAWANKPFVVLTLIYGIQTIGIAVITAGIPLAAAYLIMNGGNGLLSGPAGGLGVQSVIFAMFVLGSMISQPFWAWLSGRISKQGAFIAGSLVYAVVLAAFFTQLPSAAITGVGLYVLLIGFMNGCYQQLPWAMLPDLIDITRIRDGKNQEGTFNGLWLLGQKAANAIGPALLGILIASAGWVESTSGVVPQPAEAISTLQWAMTLLPAVFFLLSVPIFLLLSRRFSA